MLAADNLPVAGAGAIVAISSEFGKLNFVFQKGNINISTTTFKGCGGEIQNGRRKNINR